jgi:hypothetical protein
MEWLKQLVTLGRKRTEWLRYEKMSGDKTDQLAAKSLLWGAVLLLTLRVDATVEQLIILKFKPALSTDNLALILYVATCYYALHWALSLFHDIVSYESKEIGCFVTSLSEELKKTQKKFDGLKDIQNFNEDSKQLRDCLDKIDQVEANFRRKSSLKNFIYILVDVFPVPVLLVVSSYKFFCGE